MLLSATACGGEVRRFAAQGPVPLTRAFGMDPIPLPDGRSVGRTAFRAHVVRSLAPAWLRFLALDRAVAADLAARGLAEPDLALRRRTRELLRAGLLAEELPGAVDGHRSEKAFFDLSRCLARIAALHGAGSDIAAEALRALYVEELAERRPSLVDDPEHPAECQGQRVATIELYPDLSALIPSARRADLLYEVAR